MKFLTELWNRLASNSPSFFKKLQYFGLYLTGIGGGLIAIPGIPEKISAIGGYLLTAGAVLSVVAKLPVTNPEEVKP